VKHGSALTVSARRVKFNDWTTNFLSLEAEATGIMTTDTTQERFFEVLIAGDRPAARKIVQETMRQGATPETLITDLFWPTFETLERLYRGDQLTRICHHTASRLMRVMVDQNAARLELTGARNRRILAFCGPCEAEELGAQMAVDLLEGCGFGVTFGGGGIANDEILARVHEDKPDVLLMFASAAHDLPDIRRLVDTLHQIGAAPGLQIAVGGGVFNRADGLAEEIGADIWARSPLEMVERLVEEPARRATADQRTVGRNRRRKSAAA
jgi:methanogenic corrinoid protein MtbC1